MLKNKLLYLNVYTLLLIVLNDLKVLKRMLTVKFELRIYWYTNKGQISSTAPNVMKCHSDP